MAKCDLGPRAQPKGYGLGPNWLAHDPWGLVWVGPRPTWGMDWVRPGPHLVDQIGLTDPTRFDRLTKKKFLKKKKIDLI